MLTYSQFEQHLRARWVLILSFAAVGLLSSSVWAGLTQPVYKAVAQVLVSARAPETLGNQSLADQLSPDYLSTQVDVIKSNRVADLAIKMLRTKNLPGTGTSKIASVERMATTLSAARISRGLHIEATSATSRVINISYSASDAQFASAGANAFAQAYAETTLELQAEPARESANWYERRAHDLESQLARARQELSGKERQLGVTSDAGTPDAEEARLQALSGQLAVAQAQSANLGSHTGGSALPDALSNPVVQSLQAEVAKSEARRQQLAATLGPNNPDYLEEVGKLAALRQQLADQRSLVRQGTTASAQQATTGVASLGAQIAAQKQRAISSRAQTNEIAVLQQDVQNLQTTYNQISARRSQLDLLGDSGQSNVAILSFAYPPIDYSWPTPRIMIPAGLIFGLLLGIALSIALQLLHHRLYNAEDFEDVLRIPNLGTARLQVDRRKLFSKPVLLLSNGVRGDDEND